MPYEVEIIWMQTNDTTRIRIDKENLKQFFPKNEWRDYNRYNQQL
jgi:plasmid replication initiation protein